MVVRCPMPVTTLVPTVKIVFRRLTKVSSVRFHRKIKMAVAVLMK